jgi:hypothetical protein
MLENIRNHELRLVAIVVYLLALMFGGWVGMVGAQEPAAYPMTDIDAVSLPTLDRLADDTGLFVDDDVTAAGCNDGCYGQCSAYPDGVPRDLAWGCGGSPFRTGPGNCDQWRVGPIWDVGIDGMMLRRDDANLVGLENQMQMDAPGVEEFREQFEYNTGARMFLTGKIPGYVGYQVQFGYEGIEDWDSAIVFRKNPNIAPPSMPTISERHTLNYRSSFHSAELDVVRGIGSVWKPYGGMRFIRFADEIRDEVDQASSPPLAGNPPQLPVTTSDSLNLFDVTNNLVGVQAGLRRDLWQIGRRFSLEGFVNMGLYVNMSDRTNTMTVTTTQVTADDTMTPDNEARTDVSQASNTVATDRSEMAYVTEASLSGVCRINRCLALRGGYQVLWMGGLHLAENAYLNPMADSDQLLFHGFHVGAEYRR